MTKTRRGLAMINLLWKLMSSVVTIFIMGIKARVDVVFINITERFKELGL